MTEHRITIIVLTVVTILALMGSLLNYNSLQRYKNSCEIIGQSQHGKLVKWRECKL